MEVDMEVEKDMDVDMDLDVDYQRLPAVFCPLGCRRYNHCFLDEGNHRSPRSPPVSTVANTRDCLKFRVLKYKVVTATKVVGEHSHPNLSGRRAH